MGKRKSEGPWRPFKNVNFIRLLVRALVIFFFIGFTFACNSWRDEGVITTGLLGNMFADIYAIFQYPSLYILYAMGYYTWTTYIIGLFINAYLWSIAIGIVYYILSKFFNVINSFILRPIGLIIMIVGFTLMVHAEKGDFAKTLNNVTSINLHGLKHDLEKKNSFLYNGFITLVTGFILIRFSLSRKEPKSPINKINGTN
jgi:hypothetical protein